MIKKKSVVFAVLIAAVCSVCVVGQTPPPPDYIGPVVGKPVTSGEKFFSVDHGFEIGLPRYPYHRSVPASAGLSKGGVQFVWRMNRHSFVLEIDQLVKKPEDSRNAVSDVVGEVIASMAGNGYRVIDRKEIKLDDNPGLEMKYGLKGFIAVARYFVINDELWAAIATWPEGESGEEQVKALDTLRLVDVKAYLASELERVTPAPLPQKPVVKFAESDAERERLKGRVSTVTRSTEYVEGTGSGPGVRRSSDDQYDKAGNRVKHVMYDYRGNPFMADVYGFVGGKRVSLDGPQISYEYNPPPPPPAASAPGGSPVAPPRAISVPPPTLSVPPPAAAKPAERPPADERYSWSYEYKYSGEKLTEDLLFNNRGELTTKRVYTYEGTGVTETSMGPDEKVRGKVLTVFDAKGNLIEATLFSRGSYYPDDSKYQYTYLEFDAKGNWTKREVKGKAAVYNGGTRDTHYFEYRTITYF